MPRDAELGMVSEMDGLRARCEYWGGGQYVVCLAALSPRVCETAGEEEPAQVQALWDRVSDF